MKKERSAASNGGKDAVAGKRAQVKRTTYVAMDRPRDLSGKRRMGLRRAGVKNRPAWGFFTQKLGPSHVALISQGTFPPEMKLPLCLASISTQNLLWQMGRGRKLQAEARSKQEAV
jgi:hypothetical protein